MAVVVSIPQRPANDTVALLRSTLAFENVVDALIYFDVLSGKRESAKVPPHIRQEYRVAVIQMLNERDILTRSATEHRVAEFVAERVMATSPMALRPIGLVDDALDLYRATLQHTPVRGVGAIR